MSGTLRGWWISPNWQSWWFFLLFLYPYFCVNEEYGLPSVDAAKVQPGCYRRIARVKKNYCNLTMSWDCNNSETAWSRILFFKVPIPHRDSRFWFQITCKDSQKSPIRFHFTLEMHNNLIFLSIIARNWKKMCNFALCFARDIRHTRLYTSNHHLGQESQTPKERRRIVRRRFSDWSGLWWAGSVWK